MIARVRKTYSFSASHETPSGVYGHNYRMEVVLDGQPSEAAAASERVRAGLISAIHSKDLSRGAGPFSGGVLDDATIARTLARAAVELARPVPVASVCVRRNDDDAIEVLFP
ncbi:MAG: hypothetical protein MOGMAGMI_00932 [Candidatus Omnitrophica bacterium]|nr:hypothetical protein [Candidatus Omnitrophota bacterium]